MENQPWPTRVDISNMSFNEQQEFIKQNPPRDLLMFAKQMTIPYYSNRNMPEVVKPILEETEPYWLEINDHSMLADCYRLYSWYYKSTGDLVNSIEILRKGMKHADISGSESRKMTIFSAMGSTFLTINNKKLGIKYHREAYLIARKIQRHKLVMTVNLCVSLFDSGHIDESYKYALEALSLELESPSAHTAIRVTIYQNIASYYVQQNDWDNAREYAEKAIEWAQKHHIKTELPSVYVVMGKIHLGKAEYDDAEKYLTMAYKLYSEQKDRRFVNYVMKLLAELYDAKNDLTKAYKFLTEYVTTTEELNNEEEKRNIQNWEIQLELEKHEKEFEKRLGEARLKTLTKIASNIAHEVQNPLQFVNNFSEVNIDLVEELTEYNADKDTEGVTEVAADLKENSHKIRDYGIRISKIVDQLLEQTRKAEAGELEVDGSNPHDFSGQN